ncbi:hypothetical protein RIO-1_37 [Pseudoalteromonas phage RIO-1]|uniref:Coil containing protein n=1 Tax=Pseudoalteromonas phage RIO-1 TaxID=1316739 RepID=R4JGV3_9CAUD|nr:internal virion protein [Pseudoalteromonas phage RIO-1]AGK87051.1 hypothetical protein RIO-1_37 [Pseudoalteromonas phage RIO-1]
MADTDFYNDAVQDTSFFDGVSARPPVSSVQAGERATLTAVQQEGVDGLSGDLVQRVKQELEVYGLSTDEQQARSSTRTGLKGPITEAALTSMPLETTEDAENLKGVVQDELGSIEQRDEIADMIVNTMESLPEESRKHGTFFNDLVNKTLADRASGSIIDLQIQDEFDSASGIDLTLDFVEAVFGGQIIGTRKFQTEVLEKVGVHGISAGDYVFKADDVDALYNYVQDASTAEEQIERVEEIVQIISDTQSPFGENVLYRTDFLTNLRAELEREGGGTQLAAMDDVLDATEVGFIAKSLTGFLKASGAKLFGSAAAANKTLSSEDADYIRSVMQEATEALSPSNGVAHKPTVVPVENKGSLLDTLAVNKPETLRTALNAAEASGEDLTQYLGVTKSGIASRLTPTGTADSGLSYTATEKRHKLDQISEFDYSSLDKTREEFERLVSNQNVSDILTQEELESGVERSIQTIYAQSRATLHPQSSWEALEKNGDFLKARAIFGKDGTSGFDTLRDAEIAKRNLFVEGKISARVAGENSALRELDEVNSIPEDQLEYFIDVEVEHQVTSKDVNPLEGKVDSYLPAHSYLIPFSSRVEKSVVDSAMAYTDKASRIAVTMQDFTKPIGKLRGKMEREQWTRLLTHGDEHGITFNKVAAKEYLGKMSDRVWDAYVGTRSFYDGMAIIRNKAHRSGLAERGFRGIKDGINTLEDSKGKLFGIPMAERPFIVPEAAADSLTQVNGTKIFNSVTGTAETLTDDLLDAAYAEGNIVVRTHRPLNSGGELFDFSIVRRDTVQDLPHQTMNIRKGHVDLNYLGEDSFFSKYISKIGGGGHSGGTGAKLIRKGNVVRNGIQTEATEVIGIYRDTKQAAQAAEDLGEEGLEVISSREAVSELGVDSVGTSSNVPSHARGRGQRLLGPSGYAEVADVEDSIGRALGEARRYTGMDSVNVLKSKFMATYGKHLGNAKEGFPSDFSRTQWRGKDKPEIQKLIRDAKAYHGYIKNQEAALTGTLQTKFLEDLRSFVGAWRVEGNQFQEFIGDAGVSLLDTDFVKVGTKLTAAVFIAARPLYQTLANAAQSAFLFAHNPVRAAGTFAKAPVVLAGLMMRGNRESALMNKVLGKTMGLSGEEFSKYLQDMLDSGMFSTSLVDDMFGLFESSMKVQAGKNSLMSSNFWKSMLPGGGLGGRAMSAMMFPQKVSTDVSNLLAYIHATTGFQKANKGRKLDSALAKRTILGDARRLTFTQNRADQFTYQQNLWSVQLQFMQHVHKMFLQLVVDPTVSVASLGKLSAARKGTNPWGGSFGQSAMTLGTITAMFGLESKLGTGVSTDLVTQLQEAGATEDMIDITMDGIFGKVTEQMYGEELDLASRFSPIGFVGSTLGLMFTHDGALNLAGPSGSLWKTVGNMASIAKAFHSNAEVSEEEGQLLLNEAANVFAGMKDYQRYETALNFGEYRTTAGRKIADISTDAAIPLLFSVPPKAAQRYYDTLDEIMSTKENVDAVTKSISSYMLNEMNNEPFEAITSEKAAGYMIKAFKLADLAFSTNPNAARQAKDTLAKEFIRPEGEFMTKYATKLAGRLSPTDATAHLTQLKQNNPEQTQVIDALLQVINQPLEEE